MRRNLVPKDAVPQPGGAVRTLPPLKGSAARVSLIFAEAILEKAHTQKARRAPDFVVSLLLHGLVLAVLILVPLYFTEAIDLSRFNATYLVAPLPPAPAPPPPPAAAASAPVPKKSFATESRLTVPTVIPKQIVVVKDQMAGASPLEPPTGVAGGVPGGVVGGQIGGVLGGVLSDGQQFVPPAPDMPPAAPPAVVRVGGNIKRPQLITRIEPVYPKLAIQAHLQSEVLIEAIIDTQGNISEARVISGNLLFAQAALDAVRRWKYAPSTLNGRPVAVELEITLVFHMR